MAVLAAVFVLISALGVVRGIIGISGTEDLMSWMREASSASEEGTMKMKDFIPVHFRYYPPALTWRR
jgi:multisubunit Na+/H+ antiporter MnhG subunit